MKTYANRLIAFAASALAFGTIFGTTAFGQTRLTVEVPFAFETAQGKLPAGSYDVVELRMNGVAHVISLRSAASGDTIIPGIPVFDGFATAGKAQSVDFACTRSSCRLTAIKTNSGTLTYGAPRKAKGSEVATVTLPIRALNGD